MKTVAALAGKETNRSAATANASTLNFITISFLSKLSRGIARQNIDALLMGKGDPLNPKIVFEIEDRTLVTEPSSQFAKGCANRPARFMAARLLDL